MIQIANIETTRAERLMKALCNHFARKTDAGYEDDRGFIQFGDGRCELQAGANRLTLFVEAQTGEQLARVQHVVISHLLRFSPEEDLPVIWVADSFQQLEFHDPKSGVTLKYNLFTPGDLDPEKSYPLVLFIHDLGVLSDHTDTTLYQGLGAVIWATPAEQAKHPCFVLAPQYATKIVNDESEFTPEVPATAELVKALLGQYNIDPARLYTTGQSMGCMASIALLIDFPDLFAAALLVAGQWDAQKTAVLGNANLWVVVAEGDEKAFPGMNASMAALEAGGAKVGRATWDGRANPAEFAAEVERMLAEDTPIKYTVLQAGTVVPEGLPDDGINNHMNTWPIAYRIDGLRDWLLTAGRSSTSS